MQPLWIVCCCFRAGEGELYTGSSGQLSPWCSAIDSGFSRARSPRSESAHMQQLGTSNKPPAELEAVAAVVIRDAPDPSCSSSGPAPHRSAPHRALPEESNDTTLTSLYAYMRSSRYRTGATSPTPARHLSAALLRCSVGDRIRNEYGPIRSAVEARG